MARVVRNRSFVDAAVYDQVKDPAYAPYLLQRAAETLARDKNRPCVLAWSIGNENPMGTNFIKPAKTVAFAQSVDVQSPRLSGLESPALYRCVTEVYRGTDLADRVETRFGSPPSPNHLAAALVFRDRSGGEEKPNPASNSRTNDN